MKISESKIALILYTLRDFCATYDELDQTFKECDIFESVTLSYENIRKFGIN